MVRISVLGDALKTLSNAEKRGKRQVLLRPSSKVVVKFLSVMLKKGYIGEFEFVDDHRAGKIIVELNGRLNKCGVISPRYDISHDSIEDWVSFFFFLVFFGARWSREEKKLIFFVLVLSFLTSRLSLANKLFFKTGREAAPLPPVRRHRADDERRDHGPRGGEAQEGRRKGARVLLLKKCCENLKKKSLFFFVSNSFV